MRRLNLPHIACAAALVTLAPKALAIDFNFQAGDTAVSAVLNNTVTQGAPGMNKSANCESD